MEPRRLIVLDINDQAIKGKSLRSGTDKAQHFTVKQLSSWRAVQNDLAREVPVRPDILLIDIDFDHDVGVSGVDFQIDPKAKPVGPVLALPYLNSRAVSAAAIYSAHLMNPDESPFLTSPWVLIPMSLIAASQERMVFRSATFEEQAAGAGESGDGDDSRPNEMDDEGPSIEGYMRKLNRAGAADPAKGLEVAMYYYEQCVRQAVLTGRLKINNAESLRTELERMKNRILTGESSEEQVTDKLFLETYSESHGIDCILWSSLCADILDFVDDKVDELRLDDMLRRLEGLCGSDPVYEKVMRIIEEQQIAGRDSERLPRFDRIAKRLFGGDPPGVLREILRLGVLLANVHAWAVKNGKDPVNRDVLERLGIDSKGSVRTYDEWFDVRDGNSPSSEKIVCPNTLKVSPPLDLFSYSGGKDKFLRLGETPLADQDRVRIRNYLASFAKDEYGDISFVLSLVSK